MNRLPITLSGLALLITAPALAQEAPPEAGGSESERNVATSLDEQPAVRHRLLLVKGRFELTPAFESTVNADYRYTLSGGLRAEYHFSDMFSAGAVGFFGTGLNTGLSSKIIDSLDETNPDGDPEPTRDEYQQHLNDMPIHGAAYFSVTPWYGKLAAFGKAFVNFDFYFQGGVAFAMLSNDCSPSVCDDDDPLTEIRRDADGNIVRVDPDDETSDPIIDPDNNPNDDPPLNDGTKVGLYLGGGIHVFLTNWLALDLTVRNYLFSNNPSGLDTNFDYRVTADDTQLQNHLFVGIGASIFFPMRPERTP
ncbi:outer membrane beta-barrel domain-containing protein [Haliangium sp.]|uniref:outer membrane beta-barrel domain-containing protein n=1 Tax=Haliangium sp. TaxID=2663208 RepID=UPI003D12772E